jgi:hypothetical protein
VKCHFYDASDSGELTRLPRGIIVEKVLEYLSHKTQYQNAKGNDIVPNFKDRIPPELALDMCVPLSFAGTSKLTPFFGY